MLICAFIFMYTRNVCVNESEFIYAGNYACIYTSKYVCLHVYISMHMYVAMCMCMNLYVCIYLCYVYI